ncbi:MAG: class I SAM-dependent methyltransferase [Gammaproteobacteria bacterium]|nr:class I SAM-dependent methyltransferase [Gammaproteobacteria bacterium]
MDEAEFDKFASEYRALHATNIRLSGEAPEFFAEYKVIDVAAALAAAGSNGPLAVLDFGAGIGYSVPHFARHLPEAEVTCLDVSRQSLALGAANHGTRARFVHFDGVTIPFPDSSFDVAFASCVFHHVPAILQVALFRELRRVLRPAGTLFVFEHNPLNPLTRHAVNTCPFDANARLLGATTLRRRLRAAGFAAVELRYRIFFPAALRRLRPLERYLAWLPLGAQYCARARR